MSEVEVLARSNRISAMRSNALEKLREGCWPKEKDRTKAKLSVDAVKPRIVVMSKHEGCLF